MNCTCPDDWQGMQHTAGCMARATRVDVLPNVGRAQCVTINGKPLTHPDGRPLAAGDIVAGSFYTVDIDTGTVAPLPPRKQRRKAAAKARRQRD